VSSTDCSGSLCVVTTPGNGPSNAVRISVIAINAIGESDATQNSGSVWSDVIPAPPTALNSSPVDQGLKITWNKPSDSGGGSAITRYVVSIDGGPTRTITVPSGDAVGTSYSATITDPRIDNGSAVNFSVSARNDSFNSLATWNSASGVGFPAGPPIRADSPTASASVDNGTTATLSWSGAFSSNGRSINTYYAAAFTGAAPSCAVSGDLPADTADVSANGATVKKVGTSTSTTFTGLVANTTYSFVVFAFNGMGCTASVVVDATPREQPGRVTDVTIADPTQSGDATWDAKLTSFDIASGSNDADQFLYRLTGSGIDGSIYGPVDLNTFLQTNNGSQYGHNTNVRVKACRTYPEGTLCSANWSDPFPIGIPVENAVPAGLSFVRTVVGDDAVADTGEYSWASAPDGAYTSVSYSCDGGVTEVVINNGEGGVCDVTEELGSARTFAPLTITINANGTQYVRTYDWQDYD
jgi:large repetitive protein